MLDGEAYFSLDLLRMNVVSKENENENAQLHEIESNAQQGFVHLDLLVLELHLSQKLLDK